MDIALDVSSCLEQANVPYVIGGSVASSIHGEPRATMDVDFVAGFDDDSLARVIESLRPDYYLHEDAAYVAMRVGGSFNAIHVRAAIKVDFFAAGTDPFERERLKARISVEAPGDPSRALWVDTAEHTILRKLEWFRRGGEVSDRQWRDVRAIVEVQGERLDRRILERWAPTLGVSDLLQKLLAG
jgi:hypothetical protein